MYGIQYRNMAAGIYFIQVYTYTAAHVHPRMFYIYMVVSNRGKSDSFREEKALYILVRERGRGFAIGVISSRLVIFFLSNVSICYVHSGILDFYYLQNVVDKKLIFVSILYLIVFGPIARIEV